jgi:hypothetical protein
MARKPRSEELLDLFERKFPNIRSYVTLRMLSGKNLYDARTHKVRAPLRDEEESGAILFVVRQMLEETGKRPQFFKDEQRRLEKMRHLDGFGPLVAFAISVGISAGLLVADLYDFFQ